MVSAFNAFAGLGILGNSSSGTGPSAVSALAAFRKYEKDQVAARKAFAKRTDVTQAIDAFKKGAKALSSVDDLLKDRRTLHVVLSAFGLEKEIGNVGKLRGVLKSDPHDLNSFANRLADSRFGELAAFLDIPQFGLTRLKVSDRQAQLVDRFLNNEFEKSLGQQNPAVRDALFFLRRIGSVENSFQILADLPLRSIVTDALKLPREIARQSVDRQASLIDAKLDLAAMRPSAAGPAVTTPLQKVTADLSALSGAKKQIQQARTVVDGFVTQLEALRASLKDHAALVDPAGVNAAEIAVQDAALPALLRQHGLTAAADLAVRDTRTAVDRLTSLFNKARNAADADALADIQAAFAETADAVLGPSGFINSAVYTDPVSGLTQNILRNGTGGALPAGLAPTESRISTQVATDGTRAITNSTDLAGFLTNLQAVRDAVAAADFATLKADLDAAQPGFDQAKSTFAAAEQQTRVNRASLDNAVRSVRFANSLDTPSLSLGLASVDDSLARAARAEEALTAIARLAAKAQEPDADIAALDSEYADRLASLTAAISEAGSVSDGTTTIGLDNLLTVGTRTYPANADTAIRAEGGALDAAILANLPTGLTAENAAGLAEAIETQYRPALDSVTGTLTRDRRVAAFAADVADPLGALDARIRKLANDLDASLAKAGSGGVNLLSPLSDVLKISLGSLGAVLSIEPRSGFQQEFRSALSGYGTAVLAGGDRIDRIRTLNDALFAAGRAASGLRAEATALDIQIGILTEKKAGLGGPEEATGFLQPIAMTPAARKFIERYLIQKDMEASGVGAIGGRGAGNVNALLIGQIRPVAIPGRRGFSILT